ncbi:hypothetical protein SELMODRAFT_414790 [Selaginella moellendorffii]|uniref:DEK C-terminal domain-containing protein n=1 Tax=Selaginella moellendorffii TaxID=88036 RepID=D8RUM3_SELML|nr:hypothetical protein SELMODRAFT_414790 [Selaginella moellendorffii]
MATEEGDAAPVAAAAAAEENLAPAKEAKDLTEKKSEEEVKGEESIQGVQTQEAAPAPPEEAPGKSGQEKEGADGDSKAKAAEEEEDKKAESDEKEDEKEKEKEKEGESGDATAMEGVEEKDEKAEEDAENGEAEASKPQPKKRGRPRKDSSKAKEKEVATPSTPTEKPEKGEGSEETPKSKRGRKKAEFSPPIDRPSREKKSIERFGAGSLDMPKSKDVYIRKGGGTPLKEIPNGISALFLSLSPVAYKLSKINKNDPVLKTLHYVFFAQRSKAATVKQNLLQFSGHCWGEKEKDQIKARERLEKCHKDELNELIDILDLNMKGKKEDLVAKVFEFLAAPHATTDIKLEDTEKEQAEKKRKGKSPGRPKKQDSDEPPKRSGRKRKQVVEEDDEEESDDDDEIEQKKTSDEEGDASESADDTEADSGERPPPKKQKTDTKVFTRKKKETEKEKTKKKEKTPAKSAKKSTKGKEKSIDKEGGDEAQSNHSKDEEIRTHVKELLQTLDLKKASFTVIIKKLGERLNIDCTDGTMKSRAKALIREELRKLPDTDDEVDKDKAKPDEKEKVAAKAEEEKSQAKAGTKKSDGDTEMVDAAEPAAEEKKEDGAEAAKEVEEEEPPAAAKPDVAAAKPEGEIDGEKKSQESSEKAQRDEVMAES